MKCTSCNNGVLEPSFLEAFLPAHTCTNCCGSLLHLKDYLRWLESVDLNKLDSPLEVEVMETSHAMICPKTSTLMTKYRIAANTDHRIDLSPSINAVWLDHGEWDLLKERGLAGKLNSIFTDPWQKKVRLAKTADMLTQIYSEEFGEAYEKIREFKNLLNGMDNQAQVIAYLVPEDPYST